MSRENFPVGEGVSLSGRNFTLRNFLRKEDILQIRKPDFLAVLEKIKLNLI